MTHPYRGHLLRVTDWSAYDEEIVRWLMARERSPFGPIDAVEAVRRMAARGESDGQIADALGFRRRSVLRLRSKHGIPAGVPHGSAPMLPYPTRPVAAR